MIRRVLPVLSVPTFTVSMTPADSITFKQRWTVRTLSRVAEMLAVAKMM